MNSRYELIEHTIIDKKKNRALSEEDIVRKLNNKTNIIKILQHKIDKLEELLMLRKIEKDNIYGANNKSKIKRM